MRLLEETEREWPWLEHDEPLNVRHARGEGNRTELWVDDTRLIHIEKEKIAGLNKYTLKPYSRHKVTRMHVLYKRNGRIFERWRDHTSRWKTDVRLSQIVINYGQNGRDHVTEFLGFVPTVPNLFPRWVNWWYPVIPPPYNEIPTPPQRLAKFMQAPTDRELVEQMFGKTRYRKDLLKAVAQTDPVALYYAQEFRGLVPIDWIISFLRDKTFIIAHDEGHLMQPIRKGLKQLDQRSLKSLLSAEDYMPNRISDIGKGLDTTVEDRTPLYGGHRVRTWDEWHNLLWPRVGHVNYHGPNGNVYYDRLGVARKPIAFDFTKALATERVKTLSGVKTPNGSTFILPQTQEELRDWSNYMGNCISGYAHEFESGHCILLGVTEADKMIANIEVRNGQIRQLLGRFNAKLDKSKHDDIVEGLQAVGVAHDGNYWGKV